MKTRISKGGIIVVVWLLCLVCVMVSACFIVQNDSCPRYPTTHNVLEDESRLRTVKFEGHYYVTYRHYNGGIVHSPNCPCHKQVITK